MGRDVDKEIRDTSKGMTSIVKTIVAAVLSDLLMRWKMVHIWLLAGHSIPRWVIIHQG